jgi:hypothetical protein
LMAPPPGIVEPECVLIEDKTHDPTLLFLTGFKQVDSDKL